MQKYLAELGLGSRRSIDGWIAEGRVRVNGRPAKLGERVTRADRIRVDGQEVAPRRQQIKAAAAGPQVIAYNKPEGEVVTRHDPEDRPTVFRRLPRPRYGRWIAVGRLDLNTSGLILFTNDGELANRLMHPSREIEREYAVRILGPVAPQALAQLTDGVTLEDGPARFETIAEAGGQGANRWYHVVLREGRNREVRRLWEAVGCQVSRLIRVRYGSVSLGARLFSGNWRPLSDAELDDLLALAGMAPVRPRRRRPPTFGTHQPTHPDKAPATRSEQRSRRPKRLP
ncbi:pseudouridine synthase family protein [Thioflavicoccus mobilis 8321]|uniref:Pseudouridine synthase n=1 Tax=Thioflavicoccus mobilis 8321 TaxID=765912 RepID=L0GZM6_9GAMM|nr:pseudouridine synthase [Thioflavicoccus mobilis]AGA90830.1 pseudouridine synthase family protein [Thioflavicoccus mobilis 8321]